MAYYAQFNERGRVIAMYDTSAHDYDLPEDAVELSEDDASKLAQYQDQWLWDGSKLVEHTPPPPPPVVFSVAKIDVLRQLNDDDFARLDAKVKEQTPRIQAIYNTAVNFVSDSPEYGLLYQMATELFGEDRAKQLLGQEAAT